MLGKLALIIIGLVMILSTAFLPWKKKEQTRLDAWKTKSTLVSRLIVVFGVVYVLIGAALTDPEEGIQIRLGSFEIAIISLVIVGTSAITRTARYIYSNSDLKKTLAGLGRMAEIADSATGLKKMYSKVHEKDLKDQSAET